ncbi:hypothetical protein NL529_30040, partial [Klebsiella pneumoniae]|nr:hypothetical protein [Klebsiella pneumoniae]
NAEKRRAEHKALHTVTLRALELADVLLAVGRAHAALAVRLAAREVAHVLAPVRPPLPAVALYFTISKLAYRSRTKLK